jgi:cell division protein FtsL
MTKREFLITVLVIASLVATCIVIFDRRAACIQQELHGTNQQLQELNEHLKKIAGD